MRHGMRENSVCQGTGFFCEILNTNSLVPGFCYIGELIIAASVPFMMELKTRVSTESTLGVLTTLIPMNYPYGYFTGWIHGSI